MFFDQNFLQMQQILLQNVKIGSGACPASYSVGTRSKVVGAWVDHSTLSSAKVKNEWSYIPTPPIHHRDTHRENTVTLHCITLVTKHQFIFIPNAKRTRYIIVNSPNTNEFSGTPLLSLILRYAVELRKQMKNLHSHTVVSALYSNAIKTFQKSFLTLITV